MHNSGQCSLPTKQSVLQYIYNSGQCLIYGLVSNSVWCRYSVLSMLEAKSKVDAEQLELLEKLVVRDDPRLLLLMMMKRMPNTIQLILTLLILLILILIVLTITHAGHALLVSLSQV